MEANRFTLIYLEGRGVPKGWSILVEKLHCLGVISSLEERKLLSPVALKLVEGGSSSVDPMQGGVWIRIEEKEAQRQKEV